jgi:hypothetical protein
LSAVVQHAELVEDDRIERVGELGESRDTLALHGPAS